MTATAVHKVLHHLVRRKAFVVAAHSTELSLPICFVLLMAAFSLRLIGVSLPTWFGAVNGIAAAVALSLGIGATIGVYRVAIKPPSFRSMALTADRHYRLCEQLTAAEELIRTGRSDIYTEALLQDLDSIIDLIVPAEVFPLKGRKFAISIPVLLAAVITIASIPNQRNLAENIIVDEGGVLENYGRRMAVRAEEIASPDSIALAEEIERLGSRMRSGAIGKEEGQRALADLAQRIDGQVRGLGRSTPSDGEQPLLSQELRNSLNRMLDDQLSGNEARQLKQQLKDTGEFTQRELDTLEEAFKPYENGDSAPSDERYEPGANTGRDLLRELGGAQELLEEAEGQVADSLDRIQGAASGEPTGESADSRDPRAAQTGKQRSEKADTSGDERGSGESESDGSGNGEELIAGKPGIKEAADQPGDATELSAPETPTMEEVRGTIASRDAIKALVRNLPESVQTDLAEASIATMYSRQYEETVFSNAVPESMKEYVRTYFLSIGMTGTEQGEQQ